MDSGYIFDTCTLSLVQVSFRLCRSLVQVFFGLFGGFLSSSDSNADKFEWIQVTYLIYVRCLLCRSLLVSFAGFFGRSLFMNFCLLCRSLVQVSFHVCRSLLQISFADLFCRSLLQVSFQEFWSLLQVSCAGLFSCLFRVCSFLLQIVGLCLILFCKYLGLFCKYLFIV